MQTNLESLAKVVRSTIEKKTGIATTSFGCGVREGRLVVKLPTHHIKREVELPAEVTKEANGQIVTLFSQDHKALADTTVAMLQ